MTQGFNVLEIREHQVLFKEGEKGDAAYLLSEGEVEISTSCKGDRKVVAVLKPVSLFGEMALFLEDQRRTATATVTVGGKVVVFSREDFEKHISEAPPIISSTVNVLVNRLKAATAKNHQIPDLARGVLNILYLFFRQGVTEVPYDDVLISLAESFNVSAGRVHTLLAGYAKRGIIEFDQRTSGARVIRLKSRKMGEKLIKKWSPEGK